MRWSAQQTKKSDPKAAKADAPKATPGWVMVEEKVWLRMVDEPSHHMQQAHENFLKKDLKAAGHELYLVGGYLQVAASNAGANAKSALAASADEMDRLAKEVQSGSVKSAKDLEAAFARAEHALALDHHAKAKDAIAKNEPTSAGHYLRTVVNNIENAANWAGHELEAGATIAAKDARLVAGKLVKELLSRQTKSVKV